MKIHRLVPLAWRRRLWRLLIPLLWRWALRRFQKNPARHTREDSFTLACLVFGWNNGWSARPTYLAACVREALRATGPIWECGSGLTTLLAGLVAHRRGIPYAALEHSPLWRDKIRLLLDQCGAHTVSVELAPLKDFGSFSWYDVSSLPLPPSPSLVICDAPPASTPGGRYGLLPLLSHRLAPGCVILLDDAHREEEQQIAQRWHREFGATATLHAAEHPYFEIVMPGA